MQQHQQQENDVLSCRELSAFFLSTDRKEAMLDYEWGNATSIILPGEEPTSDSDQTRQIFDSYNQTLTGNFIQPPAGFSTQPFQQQPHQLPLLHNSQTPLHQTFDSRGYAPSYPRPPVPQSTAGFPPGQHFPPLGPKTEEYHCSAGDFSSPIGLNLGFRTYFSSTEDDLVSRLYRRARPAEPSNSPRCQAEGCNADLTHAKHYHRRHKVCEFHSKASTVLAGGLTQRFCQQCSRFHLLSEFDQGKRSCRKRLADHNRRRRKSQPQPPPPPQSENASTSLARVETSSSNLLSFSRWAGIPRPHFLKFQFLTACWHLIFPCLLSLSQSRLRNRARRLLRLLQSACRHLRNSRSTASDLRRWERRLLRRGRYSLREGLSVLMNAGSGTRKKKVGRRRNAATRSSDGLDLARSIQMRSLLKMRCMGHFSATFGEVDKPNFDQVACLIHPSASSISARINPLVSRADQRALAACLAILLN